MAREKGTWVLYFRQIRKSIIKYRIKYKYTIRSVFKSFYRRNKFTKIRRFIYKTTSCTQYRRIQHEEHILKICKIYFKYNIINYTYM